MLIRSVGYGILLVLGACVYKPGMKQGVYFTSQQAQAVDVGMSREEVEFLLGPAGVVDPADEDRVFYFYKLGTEMDEKKRLADIANTVIPNYVLSIEYKHQSVANKGIKDIQHFGTDIPN